MTDEREVKLMAIVASAANILDASPHDSLTEEEVREVAKGLTAGKFLIALWEGRGTHKENLPVLKQFSAEAEEVFKEVFNPSPAQIH